ncbi:hypothetical protein DT076_01960 [Desertihabitans brevis]|uniref:Uncharacterized protein n=1 Tax=Desertihabitans brevis TaxID=2268447 RepID=A0A367YZI7_9ACTN|nr:hypothetical protein DT076_01960 [Desertihabitans brevis]
MSSPGRSGWTEPSLVQGRELDLLVQLLLLTGVLLLLATTRQTADGGQPERAGGEGGSAAQAEAHGDLLRSGVVAVTPAP